MNLNAYFLSLLYALLYSRMTGFPWNGSLDLEQLSTKEQHAIFMSSPLIPLNCWRSLSLETNNSTSATADDSVNNDNKVLTRNVRTSCVQQSITNILRVRCFLAQSLTEIPNRRI